MNFTSALQVTGGQVFSESSTPLYRLGSRAVTRDGRVFRYAQAGGTALVVGDVIQAAAQIANHVNMTPTATPIGSRVVNVTPGATAGAANLYAEGYIVISTTPGLGYTYSVDRHAAITASTAFDVYLPSDDPIQIALTTSSRVDIRHNPYKNVIQAPANTLTGPVVGVAVFPITAAYYGWLQTWGPCGVLIGGTPGVGLQVVSPGDTAGEAIVNPATGAESYIGDIMNTGVDTKAKLVMLKIAA